MTSEGISALLTSRIIGRPVRVYQEVTSTNDLALQLGVDLAPEGCAIFAETQTNGRGRLGRSWQAQRGASLAFSILLRPDWPDISRIGLVAAVALARVLDRFTSTPAGIKWPNDIQIAGKKLAGILCEAGRGFVVVGIGLNVSQTTEDFPVELAGRSGSVEMFSKASVDRVRLAAALLNELDRIYLTLPAAFAEVMAECERRSVLLEKPIEVEWNGRRLNGVVAGFEPGGELKVRTAAGEETIISAGEVTLLKV